MKLKTLRTLTSAILLGVTSTTAFAEMTMKERVIPTPPGTSSALTNLIENKTIPEPVPVPSNTEEWLSLQVQFDAAGIDIAHQGLKRTGVTYEAKKIEGVDTFLVTPKNVAPEYKDKWLIHIHGGAFVFGGGESALREAAWVANGLGAQVISIDYRKPPLHPFPAAVNDIVTVWKELIKTQAPESTAMFGTSAGGNLTLATTLKLKELDLPVPGALFAGTPVVDLKETSDSWLTLQGLDPLGQREGVIQSTFELYAGDHSLDHPIISPIYAEIKEFPPTIFISGTRDLLLSDTARMHRLLRSADVVTDLHVYDGQSHADYMSGLLFDVPESDDALKEMSKFFNKHINH